MERQLSLSLSRPSSPIPESRKLLSRSTGVRRAPRSFIDSKMRRPLSRDGAWMPTNTTLDSSQSANSAPSSSSRNSSSQLGQLARPPPQGAHRQGRIGAWRVAPIEEDGLQGLAAARRS